MPSKDNFLNELETTLNYMIKHCGMDESEAEKILDSDYDAQKDFMDYLEYSAQLALNVQKEGAK